MLPAGPAGGLPWRLTHVAPGAPAGASAAVRELPLEAGGSGARLAGDGQGGAVLAYHLPLSTGAGRRLVGRLAYLDVASGRAGQAHTICTDPDVVVDVALEPGPPGAVAYVAVWRPPALLDGHWRPGGGRVLAVDPQTGAELGTGALPGVPARVRLAPAPGGEGRLLYCLVGAGGPDGAPGAESDPFAGGPRCLLGLDPATLRLEREHALPLPVRELDITAAGDAAYLLSWPERREVLRLDLRSGATRHLARVPFSAAALAMTPGGVHLADGRDAVLVLNSRSGTPLRTLPVGRGAVGLALGHIAYARTGA